MTGAHYLRRAGRPLGLGGGSFTPADLFASGENGAWLDMSDLSTMWTDSIGGTQATVGSTVQIVEDKSGNGNHYTQSSAARKPTLRQTAGGLYYLEFDGTDDRIGVTPTWSGTTISDAVVCAGYRERTRQNSSLFMLDGSGLWKTHAPWGDGNVYFDTGGTSSPNRVSGAMPVAAGNDVVGTFIGSVADSEQLARINGTQIAGDASGHSVSITGSSFIATDGTNYMVVNLYGFVAVVTRDLTAQEISDLESWMAGKSGVTL